MSSPTGSGIRIYFSSSLTPGFHLGPLWNVSCWDKSHVLDLKEKTLLNGNISSDIHIFKIKHFAEITMRLFIMLILKASLCSRKKQRTGDRCHKGELDLSGGRRARGKGRMRRSDHKSEDSSEGINRTEFI